MDKTVLEKRIQERAVERVRLEFKKIEDFFSSNDIARRLSINLIGESENIGILQRGCSYSILYGEYAKEHTNLEEIKNDLVEKYAQEETDNILAKISDIECLLSERYNGN